MERAITNGIFLTDQYFRTNEFIEEERIEIFRCYNCQNFRLIAKTCKSAPKCGKCAGNHSTETVTQKNPHVQTANQDTLQTIPTVKLT